MTTPAYIAEILREFVGLILLFAAVGKLKTFNQFTANLHQTFGLPVTLSRVVAPAIICAELLVAAIILTNVQASHYAMVTALCLFSLFSCVVFYKYIKHGSVACNCFGDAERPLSGYDLLRNLIIIGCVGFYLLNAGEASGLNKQAHVLVTGMALILTVIAIEFHNMILLITHSWDPGH